MAVLSLGCGCFEPGLTILASEIPAKMELSRDEVLQSPPIEGAISLRGPDSVNQSQLQFQEISMSYHQVGNFTYNTVS